MKFCSGTVLEGHWSYGTVFTTTNRLDCASASDVKFPDLASTQDYWAKIYLPALMLPQEAKGASWYIQMRHLVS